MNKDLLILQNSRTWSKIQAFVHKSIFENFLSVERSSRCFLDGRPSCLPTTSWQWMTFLCWANLFGFGRLYRRIGDGPFLVHLQLLLFLLNGGYYSKFQFIRWQFIKSFTCIKLYDLLKYLRKLYYIFHKKKLLNRVDLILKK